MHSFSNSISPPVAKAGKLAGYGIGDYGLNIYWNTLSLYLVYWYTTVVGLPPELAGALFFVGMAWDAISDPIVASISEKVRTRYGTYRPFLLFGSFFLAGAFVLLFWVPPFDGILLIVSLIIAGIIFRTSYTLVAIPYSALATRLSYDSVERTEYSGVRMFFAFAGLLTVSNLIPPLARYFSGSESYTADGFQTVVICGSIIATLALVLCFAGTREQPLLPKTEQLRLRPAAMVRVLLQNKALLTLLLVIFFQSGANASLMISMVFFVEVNQSSFAAKESVLTSFAVATMLGVPAWTLMIRMIGKKKIWVLATLIIAMLGLHMALVGPVVLAGIPLQIIGFGFCIGAFAVLMWSLIPDTVEYGQFASGYRSEGLVYGAVLVAQKLSGGLMGFTVGVMLGHIGYDSSYIDQSEQAREGLTLFLAMCPALLLLFSIIPVLLMPLNRHIHADIVNQLSSERGGKGDT